MLKGKEFMHKIALEAIEENKRLVEENYQLKVKLEREEARNATLVERMSLLIKKIELYKDFFTKYPTDSY